MPITYFTLQKHDKRKESTVIYGISSCDRWLTSVAAFIEIFKVLEGFNFQKCGILELCCKCNKRSLEMKDILRDIGVIARALDSISNIEFKN